MRLDGFILVGGSTRLKMIPKKLKEFFNKEIYNDLDPDRVVSFGAALHGHELLNGSNNLLLDVTPLSLGIETLRRVNGKNNTKKFKYTNN